MKWNLEEQIKRVFESLTPKEQEILRKRLQKDKKIITEIPVEKEKQPSSDVEESDV